MKKLPRFDDTPEGRRLVGLRLALEAERSAIAHTNGKRAERDRLLSEVRSLELLELDASNQRSSVHPKDREQLGRMAAEQLPPLRRRLAELEKEIAASVDVDQLRRESAELDRRIQDLQIRAIFEKVEELPKLRLELAEKKLVIERNLQDAGTLDARTSVLNRLYSEARETFEVDLRARLEEEMRAALEAFLPRLVEVMQLHASTIEPIAAAMRSCAGSPIPRFGHGGAVFSGFSRSAITWYFGVLKKRYGIRTPKLDCQTPAADAAFAADRAEAEYRGSETFRHSTHTQLREAATELLQVVEQLRA